MPRDFAAQLKNPTALYYFNEVAKAGSFRKASDVIHVAASAINRQVTNLETEVEAPLFERGRGRSGLKLTAAGEILLHRIKTIVRELNSAKTQIDALKGLQRGNIRMGVNEGFGRDLLAETIARFNARFPHVTFALKVASSPKLVEMAVNDEVDLIIAYNVSSHQALVSKAKCTVEPCIMVSKGHPLAGMPSVRLADCAPYGFVMPDEQLALRPVLDRMFSTAGIQPRISVVTDSYDLMRSAASSGFGLAIVSQFMNELDPAYPEAAFIPIRDAWVKRQVISCCIRKGRHLPTASLKLIEHIIEIMRARNAAQDSNAVAMVP